MTRVIQASDVEAQGHLVNALIDSGEAVRPEVKRIMAAHGFTATTIQPWYPLPDFLRCLEDIQTHVGRFSLRAIGQQLPRYTVFPPHITSFETALILVDEAYRMNHRGPGNIGGYHHEPVDGHAARMRCDNPYPCEFDQGLLEALHMRFAHPGSLRLRITHGPGGCRALGDAACTYHLKW
ncbi:hypothetical protein F0U62_39055 [Cystobacter fuscus]|uniref:hypothetical protein n=1 Tax=Cystobacter fuscus TaxID=43 RepID=UPI002B305D54|nr:hypothetical protein F0U62_39055 [Cystobacter fuscus]